METLQLQRDTLPARARKQAGPASGPGMTIFQVALTVKSVFWPGPAGWTSAYCRGSGHGTSVPNEALPESRGELGLGQRSGQI